MSAALSYALRWCVWLVRWVLFSAYAVLLFASKPGSRLICPALAAPLAYSHRLPLARLLVLGDWWRGMTPVMLLSLGLALAVCVVVTAAPAVVWLRRVGRLLLVAALVLAVLQYTHWQGFDIAAYADTATVVIDAILALELVLAASVYVVLSRMLVLFLGAFPPMVRPLRPMRALRVRNRVIRPVPVSLAVPKLPKHREQAS